MGRAGRGREEFEQAPSKLFRALSNSSQSSPPSPSHVLARINKRSKFADDTFLLFYQDLHALENQTF